MVEEQKQIEGLDEASDELKMAVLGKMENLKAGFVNMSITSRGEYVRISLETPEGKDRIPVDVVAIIDISGSMDTEAAVKNDKGQKETFGLTYLDILKHAVKTTILNLTEKDRFSLVSYSDFGRIDYPLNYMTNENQQKAIIALDNLQTEGCTNIWDGLLVGLKQLRMEAIEGQNQAIILLTDGEPNQFPKEGLIPALRNYKKQNQNVPSINTFAFGKKIDTHLLDTWAMEGLGQYCFIPCPGFIGTIFVNTLSNILTTMASKAELTLQPLNGSEITSIMGHLPHEDNKIKVGDLKFGQNRDIVVKMNFNDNPALPYLTAQIKYYDNVNKQWRQGVVTEQVKLDVEDALVEAHRCRHYFVEQVKIAVSKMHGKHHDEAKEVIKNLADHIKETMDKLQVEKEEIKGKQNEVFITARINWAHHFLSNLLIDVQGEVTLAVKETYSFEHWGQHFLPSLSHCHLKQQCNNFMDPGIQDYGGQFYKQLKDKVEMTFLKLPAPKPSKKHQQQQHNQQHQNYNQQGTQGGNVQDPNQQNNHVKPQQQPQQQAPQQDNDIDMGQFYNAGGGCFAGDCVVKMQNGFKKVRDVQKGDKILNKDGSVSTVMMKVKINCLKGKTLLVELAEGLLITPKHPILHRGKWIKPQELKKPVLKDCEAVYNFILDSKHQMVINNVVCVTLGHGLKGEKVEHAYFGTEKVVKDLKSKDLAKDGFVEIAMTDFVREASEQQVCGIKI